MIERHAIELVRGEARFEDAHTVSVRGADGGERVLQADVILIATGSVPTRAKDIPFGDPRVHDSDEILTMERLPATLAVVGAGVIGCEYATIFAALDIAVTLIDGRDRLLAFLDVEMSDRLRLQMQFLGVDVRLGEGIARYATDTEGVRLDLQGGTVYAAGDVIGFPARASTSMEQARVAMCHAFDLKYKTRVASIFPLAVYTIPEIGQAGETEESCRQKGIDYCVGRALYRHNARGQITGDLAGQIKLVFRYPDKTLLGVHIIGESAAELVHIGVMVLQFNGTIDAFINTVFNYPTLGDAYKYAAYDGLGTLHRRSAPRAPSS